MESTGGGGAPPRGTLLALVFGVVVTLGIAGFAAALAIQETVGSRPATSLFWWGAFVLVLRPTLVSARAVQRTVRRGRAMPQSVRGIVVQTVVIAASGIALVVIGLTAYRRQWIVGVGIAEVWGVIWLLRFCARQRAHMR